MMKRLFLLAAALFATPAMGQTLASGPDVGTVADAVVTYETDNSTPNRIGDGSNAKGGVPPITISNPEGSDPVGTDKSLATLTTEGWVVNDSSYCTTGVPNLAACPQKKWRVHINSSKILCDDPIRFYGQPGDSHCHEWFGNERANARTTRTSLRILSASTAAGGPPFSTAYWKPATVFDSGGVTYAKIAVVNAVYYTYDPTSLPLVDDLQMPPLPLEFIFGTNADDPMDCKVKNELDVANGGTGTTCTVRVGRYSYTGNGFEGYVCSSRDGSTLRPIQGGLQRAPGFRMGAGTADADDPWYVGGVHTCGAGDMIGSVGHAPLCWGGNSYSSRGGYWHFRQEVGDNYVPPYKTCFKGAFKLPQFEVRDFYLTQGWDDFKRWYLVSDAMFAAKCAALGQTCPTNIPGWSMHNDWKNGMSKTLRDQVFGFCLGIGTNVPHECNIGSLGATISATQSLTYGAVAGSSRNPQVDLNRGDQLVVIGRPRTSTHNMKGM